MKTREATHDDIDYFIMAGRDFCDNTGFSFDAVGYAEVVHSLIDRDDVICIVVSDPARGHSVGQLMPSFWKPDEIVCKIFTTGGKGGLKCLREVERLATIAGAKYLLADSFLEPRVIKFYERNDMIKTDVVYFKEL